MNKEEKSPNKCPICGKPAHKESKYCIFHASAEEKTKDDFKKALREYVKKIIEEESNYNFEKFIFIGNIDFKKDFNIDIFKNAKFIKTTFEGFAGFRGATFMGDTDFRGATFGKSNSFQEATFERNAHFDGATFERNAHFDGATFEGNAHFDGATFEGDTDFIMATLKGNAYFLDATFEGYATFSGTTFKGDTDFMRITFEGNAYFCRATFERNAHFDGATFKGDANFESAILKGGAGFFGTTFKGDTYFIRITFEGKADFLSATFEGNAHFDGATFKGDTDFRSKIFVGNVYFTFATFEGKADFTGATFKISTEFKGTTFKSNSNFEDVTFNGHTTYFANAIFEGNANFFVVKFKGNTNFNDAIFIEDAYFEKATFEGDADFRLKYFAKILNFSKIKTFSGKKLSIRLNNEEGKISFDRAYLENIYLDIELAKDALIDFTGALLRNTKIKKQQIENHILQEKEKKFYEAQEIFLLLKNNFHSIGQYEDESWAYKKEKDMERLSQSFPYYKATLKNENKKESFPIIKWIQKGNFKKWITLAFSNVIYGYGEKPWNVVKTALAIIIIFALSFSLIGIGNPEIIELKGTAIHSDSGNIADLASKGFLKNNEIRNFPDCLYFSLITFTTLGYGDFRPLEGLGRILAGSEAFLGAIMMALFVYTFARKTGGR